MSGWVDVCVGDEQMKRGMGGWIHDGYMDGWIDDGWAGG